MHYVARARALGARVIVNREVMAIARIGYDGPWQVGAGDALFEAPLLVNAAGAWAGRVGALAGLGVPVQPARRVVFSTAPLPVDASAASLPVDGGPCQRAVVPVGRRAADLRPVEPGRHRFEEGIDWPWLEATYEAALAHFPWFEHLAIDRKACWWGYYEVTPDHNPVLGRMPGAAGWINACGFSGHGVQQAAAVGRLIAQEATGQPLFIDIDPLRIERFAHGTAHGTERLIV